LYALGLHEVAPGSLQRTSSLAKAFEEMNKIYTGMRLTMDENDKMIKERTGFDKSGNAQASNKGPVTAKITVELIDWNLRMHSLQQYRHRGAEPLTARIATHIRWS
jgi:hypothetical protein